MVKHQCVYKGRKACLDWVRVQELHQRVSSLRPSPASWPLRDSSVDRLLEVM
jgi:hypothetical protein